MNQSNNPKENEEVLILVMPETLDIRLEGLAKTSKNEAEKLAKAENRAGMPISDIPEKTEKPSNEAGVEIAE